MILESKNGVIEDLDTCSCFERFHNWLICFIVGKKCVAMNLHISFVPFDDVVISIEDNPRCLFENNSFPSILNQTVIIRNKNYVNSK